jgi:hypothetical protein
MAILLVGPPLEVGQVLIARLVAQDDEVRVVEDDATKADIWKQLGAHVALGEWDEDLVERAAQNVRTLVLFDGSPGIEPWLLEQLVTGARLARVDRVIWCAPSARRDDIAVLERSELEYMVLVTGGAKGFLRRSPQVAPEDLARAIDAADDLAGELHAVLELGKAAAWETLGLDYIPR